MADRDPALRLSCITAAMTISILAVLAWVLTPALRATHWWTSHFATVDPRDLILVVTPLALLASSAPLLWPGTWASVHLARSLRAATVTVLLYWVVAVLLEAPRLGAYAALPILVSPALATAGHIVRTPLPLRAAAAAVVASILAAVVIVLLLAHGTVGLVRMLGLVGLGAVHIASLPLILHRVRTRTQDGDAKDPSGTRWRGTPDGPHPLDLPPGMQTPGPGAFGLALGVATLLFVAFVIAPGVPLTTFVRWTALALTIPVLLRGLVRRPGIARTEALAGPSDVRVHTARVAHLPDARLALLDDPLDHWLRTGRGHRALARALAEVLAPVVPGADETRLSHALARAPRGRRHRRRRETHLATLLGAATTDADAPGDGPGPTAAVTA